MRKAATSYLVSLGISGVFSVFLILFREIRKQHDILRLT